MFDRWEQSSMRGAKGFLFSPLIIHSCVLKAKLNQSECHHPFSLKARWVKRIILINRRWKADGWIRTSLMRKIVIRWPAAIPQRQRWYVLHAESCARLDTAANIDGLNLPTRQQDQLGANILCCSTHPKDHTHNPISVNLSGVTFNSVSSVLPFSVSWYLLQWYYPNVHRNI